MNWTWRLEAMDGTEVSGPPVPSHSNQADAESWLGEHWHTLAEAGVVQVSLLDGGQLVYGPMPLSSD